METINHEYYVSLEVAKLLKEAGFDWKCKNLYDSQDNYNGITFTPSFKNWNVSNKLDYSAPTLDVSQRWLREVKGCYAFVKPIFSANRKLLYYLSDVVYDKDYTIFAEFSTYEKAKEAGIKKALELILKKGE